MVVSLMSPMAQSSKR